MISSAAVKEAITSSILLFEQPRVRRIALAVAIAIFVGGLWLAIRNYPGSLENLRLAPILLILFLGTPAMMVLLAADFMVQARFSGAAIPFARAFEVVIVGNAANMLPLPAGAAVRLAAVKSHGGTLRKGAYSIAVFAAQTLGLSLLYGGAWVLADFDRLAGAVFVSLGALCTVASSVLFQVLAVTPSAKLLAASLLWKILEVVLGAVLVQWSFGALGVSVDHSQAAIFVLAGILGTLIWIVPGGLGVREIVSAALAPLVGLDPAQGFLSATVLRCVSLIGILPLALYFLAARGRGPAASASQDGLHSDL